MQRNLKSHTVSSFDADIENISQLICRMSELVLQSIDLIDESIKQDADITSKANNQDAIVNKYHNRIDDEITAFIALRQPKAYDLRFSISSVKVSSNLERIGDYAKAVIKKIFKVKILDNHKKTLLDMTMLSRNMTKDAVSAFINNNTEKAQKVLEKDDKIDNFYKDIFLEFNDKKLNEKSRELINVLFIAKAIERLADHAVNIASIVDYVVTGEVK